MGLIAGPERLLHTAVPITDEGRSRLGLAQLLQKRTGFLDAFQRELALGHADLGQQVIGICLGAGFEAGLSLRIATGSIERVAEADQGARCLRIDFQRFAEGAFGGGNT